MDQPPRPGGAQATQTELPLTQSTGVDAQGAFDTALCAGRLGRQVELGPYAAMRLQDGGQGLVGTFPDAIGAHRQHVWHQV